MRTRRARLSSTNTAVLEKLEDVGSWDEEELIRGRPRDRNGQFRGRPPTMLPKAVYDELRRRTLVEFHEKVRENVLPATEQLASMARGEIEADAAQIRAIQELINRFAGRAPETVNVTVHATPKYEKVLVDSIVVVDDDIVDAEVVEEN